MDFQTKYPKVFKNSSVGLETGKGWDALLDGLFSAISDLLPEDNDFKIYQIKEKFGCLRVYTSTCSEAITQLVQNAEMLSQNICEKCGKPGTLRGERSWVKTFCDNCNSTK